MFKRPLTRPVLAWRAPVPFANTGRAGAIIEKMKTCTECRRPSREWVPSVDYHFIASHMDAESAKAYIERSEAWFQLHKTPEIPPQAPPPDINYAPLVAVLEKHKGRRPPMDEYLVALEKAGYSVATRDSCRALYEMLDATSEERQRTLDTIFAKWPAANKATPKPKKVIKVVKKKITN